MKEYKNCDICLKSTDINNICVDATDPLHVLRICPTCFAERIASIKKDGIRLLKCESGEMLYDEKEDNVLITQDEANAIEDGDVKNCPKYHAAPKCKCGGHLFFVSRTQNRCDKCNKLSLVSQDQQQRIRDMIAAGMFKNIPFRVSK